MRASRSSCNNLDLILEANMKSVKFLALGICASVLAVLPLNAATTGHFERTLQVSGTVELEVTSGSGNINVHQGGAGTVSVTAKFHGNNGTSWLFCSCNIEERIHKIEQNPPIVQTGNIIHIGRFEDRDLARNISIDYDVTVPPQTRLTSHTGSGDQSISGLQLPMTAKTGSGNVTVERIAGETRVSSGSGDLKINSIKGVLYADAGSGNIQAEGEPTSDWRLGAGSGNITLRVPSQASFNLDARTSSGTLKFNNHQVTTQGTLAKNHIQGKVNNGGVLLDIHTGSGDIELQ